MKKFVEKIGLTFYGLALWCFEHPEKIHSRYAMTKAVLAWIAVILGLEILFSKFWYIWLAFVAMGIYNTALSLHIDDTIISGDDDDEDAPEEE